MYLAMLPQQQDGTSWSQKNWLQEFESSPYFSGLSNYWSTPKRFCKYLAGLMRNMRNAMRETPNSTSNHHQSLVVASEKLHHLDLFLKEITISSYNRWKVTLVVYHPRQTWCSKRPCSMRQPKQKRLRSHRSQWSLAGPWNMAASRLKFYFYNYRYQQIAHNISSEFLNQKTLQPSMVANFEWIDLIHEVFVFSNHPLQRVLCTFHLLHDRKHVLKAPRRAPELPGWLLQ